MSMKCCFNHYTTDDTNVCSWKFRPATNNTMHGVLFLHRDVDSTNIKHLLLRDKYHSIMLWNIEPITNGSLTKNNYSLVFILPCTMFIPC